MAGDGSVLVIVLGLLMLPVALLGIGVWIGLKLLKRKPKK